MKQSDIIKLSEDMEDDIIEKLEFNESIGDSVALVIEDRGKSLLFNANKRGNFRVYLLDDADYGMWELYRHNVENGDPDYRYIVKIKDMEGTEDYRDGGHTKGGCLEPLVREIKEEAFRLLRGEDLNALKKEEENVFQLTTKGISKEVVEGILEILKNEVLIRGDYEIDMKNIYHRPKDRTKN